MTGRERNAALPAVPAFAKAVIKGLELAGFYGVLPPAATPKEVVARLSDAFKQVLGDADIMSRMVAQRADPAFLGSDGFVAYLVGANAGLGRGGERLED